VTRPLRWLLIGLLLAAVPAPATAQDVVQPKLKAALSALGASGGDVDVIITLTNQLNPATVPGPDRAARRSSLSRALVTHAGLTQGPVLAALQGLNARNVQPLWIANSIAARVPAAAVAQLARLSGVASIKLDETLAAPSPQAAPTSTPEWNLSAIRAPELWAQGHIGTGVVVAIMDTGVDVYHPDLGLRWRGGSNSWFDPHQGTTTPNDPAGHGTQVMGVLVGGETGGTQIGVAPGAQWIAVKLFNNAGTTTLSKIHQGFQWLLNPDGNPDVDDAPDIVSNSWHLSSTENVCNGEFAPDIAALKAAGIAVVFAAGNSGPGEATSVSPSNDPEAVAVGAVDEWLNPAYFSSRGPSACDGGIYPEVSAPGVSVRTADLTFGGIFPDSYVYVSGTSFAAPHVAGGLALLMSAMASQGTPVTVADLETAIAASALDLWEPGPDNDSGAGLLDVVAAYDWLVANTGGAPPTPPVANSASVTTNEDVAVAITLTASDVNGDPLTYTVVTTPTKGTLSGTPPNLTYAPSANLNGADSFTFRANDGQADSNVATVSITVNPVNDVPSFTAGPNQTIIQGAGAQSVPGWATAISTGPANEAGQTVTFLVSNNNSALFSTQPAVSPTGTLTYTPAASATGVATLTVRIRDNGGTANGGVNTSAAQTRTITINAGTNTPPVANPGSATTNEDVAVAIILTASDANGNPLTYAVVTPPANGTLTGTPPSLTFTPAANFNGATSFTFRANDGQADSNVATVSITVNPVNDVPSFSAGASQTVTQPAGAQTVSGWATAISPGPANEASQTVTFLVSSTNTALFSAQPAVSPTGTLTYTPAAGASGVATLSVQIQDNGGTANGGVDTSAVQTRTITVNAAPASDLIFQDGFESGSFSAWSGRQDGENDLSVTAGAAMGGGFGLAALIDNNTSMWVRDDTPDNEARYRARFYFDPNSIPMAGGNAFRILAARSGNINVGVDVARLELRRNTTNTAYQVRASIGDDWGGFFYTAWYTIADGPTAIEIDWQAATADGANDGSLTLWTAGVLRQTLSGIDNDTLRVNSVRLGPLQGIDTATRGTVYFDGFVSRRSTYIGP
jgi:bacillopeptidase F